MSTKIVKGVEMKSCEDLCKEIDFKYPRSVMYDFINTMVKLNIFEKLQLTENIEMNIFIILVLGSKVS